jgi:gas vesicle protein
LKEKNMRKLMGYDIEDVLELAGLQRRHSLMGTLLPALGLLAAGAAIGAGVGIAFAPSSGRRLWEGMSGRLDQLREGAKAKKEAHKYSEANASSSQG